MSTDLFHYKRTSVANALAGDFFYTLDLNQRFTYVNPPLLSLWKKSLSEVIGKNFEDLGYPPHLVELHREQMNATLAGHIVNGENEYTDEAGETAFYEYTFVPVMDARGKVYAIAGSTRNVTVRKYIERQLKESESNFRTFAEAMPQMVFVADPNGSITYYNKRWYDFIGVDGTEGYGWKDLPVHHPDDLEQTVARWKEAVESGSDYETEYRLRRHDGVYIWHLGRAHPVRDADNQIIMWVGTNTDINDQKIYQKKMEDQRNQREKIVAGLSHDLRSPLTAAKLKAHLLHVRIAEPNLSELARKISKDMDRADRMISDILDASLIESGEPMNLNIKTMNMTSLVQSVLDEFQIVYGPRFRFTREHSENGYWDEEAVKRILENLLSNAVKYGDDKSPIQVGVAINGPQVALSIHNKGHAIPESDLPTLFDVYKRSALAHGKPGWGLGLTLVKGLAEAHGGYVDVRSCATEGTTFTVNLPMDSRK